MLILLLLNNHVMVVWDVIIGVTGWRVYESSLYYFSNFSISLKLLQLKPKQVAFIIYENFKNTSWKILFKWSQIWEFLFHPLFFSVNHLIYLNSLYFRHIIHLCFSGLHSFQSSSSILSFGEATTWLTQAKACHISINIHYILTQTAAT